MQIYCWIIFVIIDFDFFSIVLNKFLILKTSYVICTYPFGLFQIQNQKQNSKKNWKKLTQVHKCQWNHCVSQHSAESAVSLWPHSPQQCVPPSSAKMVVEGQWPAALLWVLSDSLTAAETAADSRQQTSTHSRLRSARIFHRLFFKSDSCWLQMAILTTERSTQELVS